MRSIRERIFRPLLTGLNRHKFEVAYGFGSLFQVYRRRALARLGPDATRIDDEDRADKIIAYLLPYNPDDMSEAEGPTLDRSMTPWVSWLDTAEICERAVQALGNLNHWMRSNNPIERHDVSLRILTGQDGPEKQKRLWLIKFLTERPEPGDVPKLEMYSLMLHLKTFLDQRESATTGLGRLLEEEHISHMVEFAKGIDTHFWNTFWSIAFLRKQCATELSPADSKTAIDLLHRAAKALYNEDAEQGRIAITQLAYFANLVPVYQQPDLVEYAVGRIELRVPDDLHDKLKF